MTDDQSRPAPADTDRSPGVSRPTRAQQRRAEEFERLCKTGYTVCCGGGGRRAS